VRTQFGGFVVDGDTRQLLRDGHEVHVTSATRAAHPVTAAGAVELVYRLVAGSREYALQPGENVVGRDPKAQVRLNAPSISRRHARITIDIASGGSTIEDLGSKNGTRAGEARVNGVTAIPDGDPLRGSVGVTFRASATEPTLTDAPVQAPSARDGRPRPHRLRGQGQRCLR